MGQRPATVGRRPWRAYCCGLAAVAALAGCDDVNGDTTEPTASINGDTTEPTTSSDTTSTDAPSSRGEVSVTSDRHALVEAGPSHTVTETSPDADDSGTPSLEHIRATYTSWRRHTEQPMNISAEIFALCRLPNTAETAFVESVHGDDLYLLDWLNPEAFGVAQALHDSEQEAPASLDAATVDVSFPTGAAIVKEKLVLDGNGNYELAALGIMVKRSAGFDAATGDWEFAYWDAEDGLLSGNGEDSACGPCHAGSRNDFVFLDGSWRYE